MIIDHGFKEDKNKDIKTTFRYGLIIRGASLCPRKMFADAFLDSAAVVPIVTCMIMSTVTTVRMVVTDSTRMFLD